MNTENPVFTIAYPTREFRLHVVPTALARGSDFNDITIEGNNGTLPMSRVIADDFDCDQPERYVDAIVNKVDEVVAKLSDGQRDTLYDRVHNWLCGYRRAVLAEDWEQGRRELEATYEPKQS